MSWSSIAGITCLLCCVVMSAGRVSPPQNLSVTFLDFSGEVNWSPGVGNPPGTTYTVEMQPIGEEWIRLETCTDIESTKCPLIFDLTLDDLMESYYIRVKASWKGNSSSWTSLNTVQPYGNTLLSAPTLNVSLRERDIHVHIHMSQLVLSVLPNLRYNVQVSERNSGDHEECVMLKVNTYVCKTLGMGQLYCVRASAIHRQQQTKPHLWSEKCVQVADNTSSVQTDILQHKAMASVLFLLGVAIIVGVLLYIYLKPKASDLTPSSLKAVCGAGRILMDIPTEAMTQLMHMSTPSLRSGMTLQEYQSSCSWQYQCRVALSSLEQTDLSSRPADEEELEEEHLFSACPYSGTLDEEEQGNAICEGEIHSAQQLLEEQDWQQDQGSAFLGVPMSSVRLCLDSGEGWESGGESDSVSKEGDELGVGLNLRGPSRRNSAGDPSDSLETLHELHPHISPKQKVVCGAGRILMDIPTEAPSQLMHMSTPSLRSGVTLQEYQSSCSWQYECRVALSSLEKTDLSSRPADEEELEEEHLFSACPYSGTLDEEEQGNAICEGEIHSAQQTGSAFLDVPMSSVRLCLDSGEGWESGGESDSVSKEGDELGVGLNLLGPSRRNSAGDPSDSLETLHELHPLNKSDLSPTYPCGYEPHLSPTPSEPIPSDCSPSPAFGKSVSYLKR